MLLVENRRTFQKGAAVVTVAPFQATDYTGGARYPGNQKTEKLAVGVSVYPEL